MRVCPHCTQLVHDAATLCRFCKEPVPGYFAVAPGWKNFADEFHQATKRHQWHLWQKLSDEDRSYAQKTLGMVPPERLDFTFTQTAIDPQAGFQVRRLLTGYLLLFIMGLAFVAGVMLFWIVEIPSLASQGLILGAPTTSQDLRTVRWTVGPVRHAGPGSRVSSMGSIVKPVKP